MECLVLHAGEVVGRTTLEAHDGTPGAAALGPTLTGALQPTAAYESIRATCQQLTRAMLAEPPIVAETARAVEGEVTLPPGFDRMLEALFAVHSLGLQLTTADGDPIPTAQVLIQDLAPMVAGGAAGGHADGATEHLTVVATLVS